MIKSIQIKGCPPYDEIGAELSDCKKVNFIYGANGSGKTTISEFLRTNGNDVRHSKCEINWGTSRQIHIYVYNRKFRQLNFVQENGIPGVFTLGQDAIEDLQAIQELKNDLKNKEEMYARIKLSISTKEKDKEVLNNNFKEDAWQRILKRNEIDFSNAFEGLRANKNKFIKELENRIKNPKGTLVEKDELIQRSLSLFKRKPIKVGKLNIISEDNLLEIQKISNDLIWNQIILGSQDVDISKLIKTLDNSSWVHEGMKYLLEDSNVCPFCQHETIDKEFRAKLSSFFDTEYIKKIDLMKIKKIELKNLIELFISDFKENLGKNDECEIGKLNLEVYKALIAQLETQFQSVINKIDEKIKAPEKRISIVELEDTLNKINNLVISSNEKIEKNNQLVLEFDAQYKKLIDDVWCYCINEEKHLISTYNRSLISIEKAITGMKDSLQKGYEQIVEIKKQISKKSENLTSVQPAVDQINKVLKAYDFTSFHIEPYSENPDEQKNKYRIVREDGTEATHTLSEGEATFITFLYFMQLTKGALDKDEVNEKKIIVLDDPISSLDSNILYLVSAMVKELYKKIKDNESDVEQLFIFTHNVYFHKEASFIDGRTFEDKDVNYWIVRKNNGITKIQSYGKNNPISSTYELLWKELREDSHISLVSMQNIMRRIIENYFKIMGQRPGEYILSQFETKEEKLVCESLLYWINDGSHTIYDDIHIDQYSDINDIFRGVFKQIFEKTGHKAHYDMMMNYRNVNESVS